MANPFTAKTVFTLMALIALLTTSTKHLPAQTGSAGDFRYTQVNRAYLNSYFTDFEDFACRPAKWNGKQWIAASAVAGAGIGLYLYDAPIRDFFINNTEAFEQSDKWFLDPLGLGIWVAPVLGGMYLAGNKQAKGTALAVVKSYGYGVFTATSMKYLFQRARPAQLSPSDPYHWEGLFGRWQFDSFPSRHAMLSFAMATVIASEYKEKIWVPVLCYSLATMASVARVQNGNHWPADVLIGAAMGYGIGKFVHRTSKQQPAIIMQRFN